MKEDWIRIIETAYDLVDDEEKWLKGVAQAARPALDRGLGVVGYFFDASGDRLKTFGYLGAGADREQVEFARRTHDVPAWQSPELLRVTYRSGAALHYSFEMGSKWERQLFAGTPQPNPRSPIHRVLILNASDPSHKGCTLGAADPDPSLNVMKRRPQWAGVAAHIAAGLRLRRRLAKLADPSSHAEAILSPSGAVLHAEAAAVPRTAREALRDAAVAIDKARGRLRRADPDSALQMWRALTDGRWSLIDRFDRDGRRFMVAHRNDATTRRLRALSAREHQVASYAAMAHSNKLIAYELGLSMGTVSSHLRAALAKLGLRSRVELVRLGTNLNAHRRLQPAP
jgi:DNA-binding CsgD family transcriptional regulator